MQAPSLNTQNLHRCSQRKRPTKKVGFIFEKVLDFLSFLWYVVVLTGSATYEKYDKRAMARKHRSARGQRNNSKEMKELLGYMARHHEGLEKTFTDEQKEIFEKFHVAKSKTIEYRFLTSETAQSKELTEPSKHR